VLSACDNLQPKVLGLMKQVADTREASVPMVKSPDRTASDAKFKRVCRRF
jgi:hypothetical protein